MRKVLRDLHYAVRTLRSTPGFTAAAVVTLALGIGANTAIFSLIYAAMLQPLPFTQPDRLMHVGIRWKSGYINDNVTPAMADAILQRSRSFQSVAIQFPSTGCNLAGGGNPEFVPDRRVNSDFLRTLGVAPALGRDFSAVDAVQSNTVLLSYRLWKSHFHGDRRVLGATVWCNGVARTVIGVLPADFEFLKPADVWVADRLSSFLNDSGMNYLVIGRLRDDTTRASGTAELQRIFGQLQAEHPHAFTSRARGFALRTYREWSSSDLSAPLWFLFGAVLLVLLIACANIAGLLLARSAGRRREMAVRVALGASRGDIIRQVMTETLLLNALGAAAGVVVAWWCLGGLQAIVPEREGYLSFNVLNVGAIGLNAPTLAFTVAVALLATLLSGIAPALGAFAPNVFETLKSGDRAGTSTARQQRSRKLLLASEVALAVVLLGCSALLVRSFLATASVNLGFDPSGLQVAEISMSSKNFAAPGAIWNFDHKVIDRIRALPGVAAAATASSAPLEPGLNLGSPVLHGKECNYGAVDYRAVSPEYFRVMGIRLLGGRPFTDSDVAGSTPVAIVNRAAARACWKDEQPIGTQFWASGMAQQNSPLQVIGVADDVREYAVNLPAPPVIYIPQAQTSVALDDVMYRSYGLLSAILIRTSGSPDLSVQVRRAVEDVDPQQPIVSVAPMSALVGQSTAWGRMLMILMGSFAALALLLTCVGLYALLSYQVAQRTREIGIRMALGAGGSEVLRMMVGEALALVAVGTAVGVAGAVAAARLLKSQVYGVSPTDPLTFAVAVIVLCMVAAVASYLPVRRATRIDPIEALRNE